MNKKNSPTKGAVPQEGKQSSSSSETAEELVLNAKSRQVLSDFVRGKSSFSPKFNPRTALDVVRNDPVISGSIESLVAKAMEGGWTVKFADKAHSESKDYYLRKELRFSPLLRTILRTSMWQDVLIEIVKEDNKVVALNLLDPAEIEVTTESNGDVIRWYQRINNNGVKGEISWKPEQVVHIKFKDAILNVWGENDIRTAWDTILIKDGIRKYLAWLFQTNQFRTHFNFKDASDQEIIDFISNFKEGEYTYDRPIITQGDLEASPLRDLKDLEQLPILLKWCDEQLITLLRTTVVNLGLGGSGGRSESDSLGDIMRSNVLNRQEVIEESFNYELFPKIGYSRNDVFSFNPTDRMTKQKLFEAVQIMRNAGFTDNAIKEFMESEGMFFTTKKIFEPNEKLKANKDLMPSRLSTKDGEADKNVGTGQESSTRPEQLVQNSINPFNELDKYNNYPYVIGGTNNV